MGKIMVFGSFAVDLVSRGPHLPAPGETVIGSSFAMGPGARASTRALPRAERVGTSPWWLSSAGTALRSWRWTSSKRAG